MSGQDHFRPTTREHPVNVIPDGERGHHIASGHCACYPTLEVWTVKGTTTHRLMHRPLASAPERVDGASG